MHKGVVMRRLIVALLALAALAGCGGVSKETKREAYENGYLLMWALLQGGAEYYGTPSSYCGAFERQRPIDNPEVAKAWRNGCLQSWADYMSFESMRED